MTQVLSVPQEVGPFTSSEDFTSLSVSLSPRKRSIKPTLHSMLHSPLRVKDNSHQVEGRMMSPSASHSLLTTEKLPLLSQLPPPITKYCGCSLKHLTQQWEPGRAHHI